MSHLLRAVTALSPATIAPSASGTSTDDLPARGASGTSTDDVGKALKQDRARQRGELQSRRTLGTSLSRWRHKGPVGMMIMEERIKRMIAARKLNRANFGSDRLRLMRERDVAQTSWNSTQLCVGNHVMGQRGKRKRIHTRTWDHHNVLKVAFSKVPSSQQPTKRQIDCAAAVVDCGLHAEHKWYVARAKGHMWYFERCWDDTPKHVDFGHLSEDIAAHARYIVPAHLRAQLKGKTLASSEEMLSLGRPCGRHGIVDLFVQHVRFATATESLQRYVPVRVILGKKADHIFGALEEALDGDFSIASVLAAGDPDISAPLFSTSTSCFS